MDKARSFCISKWEVWEAYKRIRANKGAAGVDGQSIAEFEEDLKDNLFKIWNRMSSGSYFPPPVRRVDIPKVVRGWINDYGHFHKSALYRTFQHLNNTLVRWASRKYKRLRGYDKRARLWLQEVMHRQSTLFAHWRLSQIKAGQ